MNRLTARDEHGNAYYPEYFKEPCNGGGCTKDMCDFAAEVCNKIAAYEDAGLDPEQLSVIDEEYSKMAKELAELRKGFMDTEHEPVLRLSEGRKMFSDILRGDFKKAAKYQWRCPMCYSQVGLRIVRDGNIEDKDMKRTCPKCGWNIDWEGVINEERDD